QIGIVPGGHRAEHDSHRRNGCRQQKVAEIATEHHRIAPEQVAYQAPRIDLGLAVDDQIATGDQVVEVLYGRVAADEGLSLVQVGGGAAVEAAKLDCLLVVE